MIIVLSKILFVLGFPVHHIFIKKQILLDVHIFILHCIQFFRQVSLGCLLNLQLSFNLYYLGMQGLIFKCRLL